MPSGGKPMSNANRNVETLLSFLTAILTFNTQCLAEHLAYHSVAAVQSLWHTFLTQDIEPRLDAADLPLDQAAAVRAMGRAFAADWERFVNGRLSREDLHTLTDSSIDRMGKVVQSRLPPKQKAKEEALRAQIHAAMDDLADALPAPAYDETEADASHTLDYRFAEVEGLFHQYGKLATGAGNGSKKTKEPFTAEESHALIRSMVTAAKGLHAHMRTPAFAASVAELDAENAFTLAFAPMARALGDFAKAFRSERVSADGKVKYVPTPAARVELSVATQVMIIVTSMLMSRCVQLEDEDADPRMAGLKTTLQTLYATALENDPHAKKQSIGPAALVKPKTRYVEHASFADFCDQVIESTSVEQLQECGLLEDDDENSQSYGHTRGAANAVIAFVTDRKSVV